MYLYINFRQNRVSRSVKTVHTNLFAACNYNLEKSRLSDMYYLLTIRTFRSILRSICLLDIKLPRKEIIYTNDRQTDERRDVTHDNRYFFKKEKILKTTLNSIQQNNCNQNPSIITDNLFSHEHPYTRLCNTTT